MRLFRLVAVLSWVGFGAGCGSTLPELPALDDQEVDETKAPAIDAAVGRADSGVARDAAVRDAAADAASPPPLFDAAVLDAGRLLGCQPLACAAPATVVFGGATPFGSFVADTLSVTYTVGLISGTTLSYSGRVRGEVMRIDIFLQGSPVAPEGVTENEASVTLRSPRGGGPRGDGCTVADAISVSVTITRHQASAMPTEREPIVLNGQIRVLSPGWSLALPISADTACGTNLAL